MECIQILCNAANVCRHDTRCSVMSYRTTITFGWSGQIPALRIAMPACIAQCSVISKGFVL